MGAAIAAKARAWWRRAISRNPAPRPGRLDAAVLAALLLSMSWWTAVLARRRFDFYDMSIFMDAGWRVACGQRLYVDFFYIAGPVHPYLFAAFIKALGFNQWAVLAFLLVTQAVVLASAYAMARRTFSPFVAGLLAAAAAAACFLTLAHPWYDLTALALLVASWALLDAFDPYTEGQAWSAAAAGTLAALAFLAKSNAGLAGGGMMLLALGLGGAFTRSWRPFALYVLGGGVTAALLVLTLASPVEYFQQNFLDFGTSGRLRDFQRLGGAVTALPYGWMGLLAAAVIWAGGSRWRRAQARTILLLASAWITGVFTIWTGSSLMPGGGYLLGVVALLLARLAAGLTEADEGRPVRRVPGARWALAAGALSLYVLHWGSSHALEQWNWRPSNIRSDYALTSPGFEGWRCVRRVGEGVDRAAQAIRAHVPAADSLFILPDVSVLYGMTGHDSYRGIPWAFDIRNSPAPASRLWRRTVGRLQEDKPRWILLHMHFETGFNATRPVLHTLRLDAMIANEYETVWSWGDFVLLRRREPTAALPAAG